MLARPGLLRDDGGWAYEVKFDGMPAQLRVDRGELCVRSRPAATTETPPRSSPLWARSCGAGDCYSTGSSCA